MPRNLTPQQVVLFLGMGLVIAGVLVFIIYTLHKALRRQRAEMDFKPSATKMNDSAFMVASMQGIVTKMKVRETELESLLREAEQRAETSTRMLEALVREMPAGRVIFDREGFLTMAKQPARTLLEADTWSRRRYPEVFTARSILVTLIEDCLEKGRNFRRELLNYTSLSGRTQSVEVSLSPFHGRSGQLAGAICLIAPIPSEMTRTQ
jgi:signal transduction histidine kinase